MFPVELANLSIEEYYWPKDAATLAVDYLCEQNRPVVGVEHVRKLGDKWQVLDYSTYDSKLDDMKRAGQIDKSRFVELCRECARKFIHDKNPGIDEYFILTWLDEGEC